MMTNHASETALRMCEHCKLIWAVEPKVCKCGRKFFVPTHIKNLPYAVDFKKYMSGIEP